MSEAYCEVMVERKPSSAMLLLKIVLIGLCVISFFGSFLLPGLQFVFFLVSIAFGIGAYFAIINSDVEYEYLYLDKEITIDKVLHKEKRKRVAVYSVEKIEIFAPIKSYHLDDFKNRQVKVLDYSSGIEQQPERRYAFFYEGSTKVIIEPNEEFVKLVKNVAPRKVFSD